MKNNSIKLIGFVLTLFSFYYIYLSFKKLDINWVNFVELLNSFNAMLVLSSLLLYLVVLYINAAFWAHLIQDFSNVRQERKSKLIAVYAYSNIGKYLPGNFMQFIGRNYLANKMGYKHSIIFLSTLFEIGFVLFTGMLLIVVMIFFKLGDISSLKEFLIPKSSILVLVLILISLLLLFLLLYKKKIIAYFRKENVLYLLKYSFSNGIITFISIYFLLGVANYLLLNMLAPQWSILDYFNILFIFVVSWIVGFIIPGVPGGIGVREAIFIFLLSQNYEILVVTLVPIIFRLINIFGDVMFFVFNTKIIKKLIT